MRVRCIETQVEGLPPKQRNIIRSLRSYPSFALELGREYTVFAATVFTETLWLYVFDENKLWYPVWYPIHLFELVDPRLSRYWIVGVAKAPDPEDPVCVFIAFREWVADPTFYDRLTDGEPAAVEVFRKYKSLIENEFVTVQGM